jgi:hypothetical protein
MKTAVTNLMQFFSGLPIDKIAHAGSTTQTVAGTGALSPTTSLVTLANPYGQKCFINAAFSIDGGVNYYDVETNINFNSVYRAGIMLKASVEIGCSNTNIYALIRNGYHDNAGNGLALTFIIKYTLFTIT